MPQDEQAYFSDKQLAARYGVHRSTPWRWAVTGTGFPQPVNLMRGVTRWVAEEIYAWEKEKSEKNRGEPNAQP